MFDTNVLISHAVFGSATIGKVIEDVVSNHDLLLSTYVIDEFRKVVSRRWPKRSGAVERFLGRASYETVVTPPNIKKGLFEIRDELDYPVLYSAIVGFADVLVTGDKDFLDVEVDSPEILTPAKYVEKYVD